jgi:2-oxoglutarate dehydrogenase E1 component
VFHVNGDHPEAVVHCFKLAAEYRQKFHKDVVIDLVCYRRYGHNETDQPAFTQPLLYEKNNFHLVLFHRFSCRYKAIGKKATTFELYSSKLVADGVLTKEELGERQGKVQQILNDAFEQAKTFQNKDSDWLCSKWDGFLGPSQLSRIQKTGVSLATLNNLGLKLSEIPSGFEAHKGVQKILEHRRGMFSGQQHPLDWATAELLAYATLVCEGNRVRLSGQDVQRGTFSHRHCVLTDQKTGAKHNLLTNLSPKQAPFYAYNSALSEFGVLGFEMGYSLDSPNQLVIWEAQFGDFANSAQVIIDQFLASGETKWLRQSNLTMLLPHGYDGQGPEHSSARVERYLQLVDSDPFNIPADIGTDSCRQIQNGNLQVVNPSTPAQIFHLLRRQVHRKFRKPLVCISPKNLLRLPACTSPLSEFDESNEAGATFRRVIGEVDSTIVPKDVRRLLFCSGKLYYELVEERQRRRKEGKGNDVAIVRVEQIAPFPFDLVAAQARLYPNAKPYWVQEEPLNAGCYGFVSLHMITALGKLPKYIGRPSSAATATGSLYRHNVEQKQVLLDAFTLE